MKTSATKLSLFGLFSLGFGAIVGVGWSATLNNFLRCGGGSLPSAVGFLVGVILLIPTALCFAELSPAIPESGGIIAYASKAFGKTAAFLCGWFTLLAYLSILPFEAIAFGDIVSILIPGVKSGEPLYELFGEKIYPVTVVLGMVLSLIITLINRKGLQSGIKFQKISTTALLAGSILCIIAALLKSSPANLTPVYAPVEAKNHSGFIEGTIAVLAIAPCYLSGFDTIPQSLDKKSGIDLSRLGKIIIEVLCCAGVFYLAVFLSTGLAINWQQIIELPRPVFPNILRILYPGPVGWILWGVGMLATLSGLLGVWNSFYIASSRLLYSMAERKMLPALFSEKHPVYDSPCNAQLFCTIIMSVGLLAGPGAIEPLNTITSACFSICWMAACICMYTLRVKAPELKRPYTVPFGKTMAVVGAVICFLLTLNCILPIMPGYVGTFGLAILGVWLAAGIALAIWGQKNQ